MINFLYQILTPTSKEKMNTNKVSPQLKAFFDHDTATVSYIVHSGKGSVCAIIDSVLDYEPSAARMTTVFADKIIAYVKELELKTEWILETHAHADHISAAPYLRKQLGGKIAIGESITLVQDKFKKIFNIDEEFLLDGSQFDKLFADNETFKIGELQAKAIHVPGHTPADMAYVIGDSMFVGDTVFMPDVGTARCDFPGGDAHTMFRSIQKLMAYPDDTKIYVCHDYPPADRAEPKWMTTVGEQKEKNIHVRKGISEDQFVEMREKRDKTLGMPRLIIPSIQVNIRAGEKPKPENNGVSYLKVPLDQF